MSGADGTDSVLRDATGSPLQAMAESIGCGTNGIVFNEAGDVLLQKRADNGWWALPGGWLDPGESVAPGCCPRGVGGDGPEGVRQAARRHLLGPERLYDHELPRWANRAVRDNRIGVRVGIGRAPDIRRKHRHRLFPRGRDARRDVDGPSASYRGHCRARRSAVHTVGCGFGAVALSEWRAPFPSTGSWQPQTFPDKSLGLKSPFSPAGGRRLG